MRKRVLTAVLAMGLSGSLAAEIQFIEGPAKASLGEQAEIDVPKGWRFVPKESMEDFDKATQNLYDPGELGCLMAPKGLDGGFWAFFEFEDIGYIKDAADEKLDADAMWKTMTGNEDDANAARKKAGYPEQKLLAWTVPPNYNPSTQRLEWAYSFSSQGETTVNFNTRILGRKGVMRVVVVPTGTLESSLPVFNQTIAGFGYKDGNRYAQFSSGDKLAKAGLAALVVGGVAAAAGSGLLAKLWKLIVLGVIAVGGALKRFVGKLFGKKAPDGYAGGPVEKPKPLSEAQSRPDDKEPSA